MLTTGNGPPSGQSQDIQRKRCSQENPEVVGKFDHPTVGVKNEEVHPKKCRRKLRGQVYECYDSDYAYRRILVNRTLGYL